jgi:hypothetical protein
MSDKTQEELQKELVEYKAELAKHEARVRAQQEQAGRARARAAIKHPVKTEQMKQRFIEGVDYWLGQPIHPVFKKSLKETMGFVLSGEWTLAKGIIEIVDRFWGSEQRLIVIQDIIYRITGEQKGE